jgi:hypothetical protein
MTRRNAMSETKEESARDQRTHECLELLQSSLKHWSQYVVDASRLAWRWNFDAGAWTDAYATMWRDFAKDVDEVMKRVPAEKK